MKKIKSLVFALCAFALVSFLSFSCATDSALKENKETGYEIYKDNPFGIKAKNYYLMQELSVLNKADNYRINAVINKLKEGKQIKACAIGGSVTEGEGPADYKDGYAYVFANLLQKEYGTPSSKVIFNNAGLCGTPSTLGLLRYNDDVLLPLENELDLLIIEFAVNDGGEPTGGRAFECLIRNALESSKECAVIVVCSAALYPSTQSTMALIADHYKVPVVSISNAVKKAMEQNVITKETFFTDVVHPTKQGHAFMADCIMYTIKKMLAEPLCDESEIPGNYLSKQGFNGFKTIKGNDQNVTINNKGFTSYDSNIHILKKNGEADFKTNFYHAPYSTQDEFEMQIKCKSLLFAYKANGAWTNIPFGKAELYIDGELHSVLDGSINGGWNNAVTLLVIDTDESLTHNVKLKMCPEDKDKGFTIVCMGYTP